MKPRQLGSAPAARGKGDSITSAGAFHVPVLSEPTRRTQPIDTLEIHTPSRYRRAALAFAFALALGSADAPAWYHPQTGRWLNRDPIGQEGGANIHAAAENDPVNKGDALGLWTQVYRLKEAWAEVCADSDNDVWGELAQQIKLYGPEASKWVRNYDPTPKRGTIYKVPNTVFFDIGPTAFGIIDWRSNPISSYQAMIRLGQNKTTTLKNQGFLVYTQSYSHSGTVKAHLKDPAIWGFIFAGHGIWGGRGALYVPPDGVGPGDTVHHRLGLINLFACYSGAAERRGGGSDWLRNVAPGGEFLYFEGFAWWFSEPKRWRWDAGGRW